MTHRREINQAWDLVETEGALVAVRAMIEICEDSNAPAPARATAGAALLRAAGMFDRNGRDSDDKPAVDMTAEEIRQRIAQLQAEARTLKPKNPGDFSDGSNGDDDGSDDDEGDLFE